MLKKKIICSAVCLLMAVISALCIGSAIEVKAQNPIGQEKAAYLTPQDFAMTDGRNEIMLGMLYKDLELDIDLVSAAHVGYGLDSHAYEGIVIYTTYSSRSINEVEEGEYICQISVEGVTFKTPRGIAIGSGSEEIIKAYGQGSRTVMDNGYIICYTYNDFNLEFSVDQQEKVSDIILVIDHIIMIEEEEEDMVRDAYKLYFGTWVFSDIVSYDPRLTDKEERERLLGTEVKYEKKTFRYEDEYFDTPEYVTYIYPLQRESYYFFPNQISLKKLLPDNEYFVWVQMRLKTDSKEAYPGTEFFLKDDDTLYCYANECIYELSRVDYSRNYNPKGKLKYSKERF